MSETRPDGAPVGVKAIAFLHYAGAVILVLSGVIKVATTGASNMPDTILSPELSVQTAGMVQLAAGFFIFFIGNGLSKGHGWARVATLVVNTLVILNSLDKLTIAESTFWKVEFGVAMVMSLYLAFSNSASAHFRG